MDTPATMMLNVHKKIIRPIKKMISAISRSAGIAAMISGTFHCSKASKRFCLRAIKFCGSQDVVVHSMYSRSHCLVIIPNSAEVRLRIKLRIQSELIQTAEVGAWKLGRDAAGRDEFAVCAES